MGPGLVSRLHSRSCDGENLRLLSGPAHQARPVSPAGTRGERARSALDGLTPRPPAGTLNGHGTAHDYGDHPLSGDPSRLLRANAPCEHPVRAYLIPTLPEGSHFEAEWRSNLANITACRRTLATGKISRPSLVQDPSAMVGKKVNRHSLVTGHPASIVTKR